MFRDLKTRLRSVAVQLMVGGIRACPSSAGRDKIARGHSQCMLCSQGPLCLLGPRKILEDVNYRHLLIFLRKNKENILVTELILKFLVKLVPHYHRH